MIVVKWCVVGSGKFCVCVHSRVFVFSDPSVFRISFQ